MLGEDDDERGGARRCAIKTSARVYMTRARYTNCIRIATTSSEQVVKRCSDEVVHIFRQCMSRNRTDVCSNMCITVLAMHLQERCGTS